MSWAQIQMRWGLGVGGAIATHTLDYGEDVVIDGFWFPELIARRKLYTRWCGEPECQSKTSPHTSWGQSGQLENFQHPGPPSLTVNWRRDLCLGGSDTMITGFLSLFCFGESPGLGGIGLDRWENSRWSGGYRGKQGKYRNDNITSVSWMRGSCQGLWAVVSSCLHSDVHTERWGT